MKYPEKINMSALTHDLLEDEEKDLIGIIEKTKSDILTDDYQEDRIINYHISPITEEWLKDRFFFPNETEKYKNLYQKQIISLLLFLDPNMLINLQHIFFVEKDADADEICKFLDAEPCEFPENIDFEENNTIGCMWHQYSSIIINMSAIDKTIKKMKTEYEDAGLYFNEATETDIGVLVTVAHEIRHLGMANPYLDETLYPNTEVTEAATEAWAIQTYEAWCDT